MIVYEYPDAINTKITSTADCDIIRIEHFGIVFCHYTIVREMLELFGFG